MLTDRWRRRLQVGCFLGLLGSIPYVVDVKVSASRQRETECLFQSALIYIAKQVSEVAERFRDPAALVQEVLGLSAEDVQHAFGRTR